MSDLAIEVRGLRKTYRTRRTTTAVLDGVDLMTLRGSVTALLGPNGAGRTTTVHVLSTLVRIDAGSVRVDGFDVVRQAVEGGRDTGERLGEDRDRASVAGGRRDGTSLG